MVKFIKIIIGIVALTTAAIIISFAILVNLNFNDYRKDIAAEISKSIGREFKITDNLEIDIGMHPTIKASGITLDNTKWGRNKEMLTIDNLMLKFDLLSLFYGIVDIDNIEISGVNLLLEQAPSGIYNYDFNMTQKHDDNDISNDNSNSDNDDIDKFIEQFKLPILRQISLDNIKITFFDAKVNSAKKLHIKQLALSSDGKDAPIEFIFDAVGDDNISANINGALGSIAAILSPSKTWNIDVNGNVAGFDININGNIKDPIAGAGIDLQINIIGNEISNIAKLFLFEMQPMGKFSIASKITGSINENIRLDDFMVKIANSDIAGNLVFTPNGDKITINGELSSNILRLADFKIDSGRNSTVKIKNSGEKFSNNKFIISDAPIDFKILKLINLDMKFDLAKVIFNNSILNDVEAQITIDDGKLTIDQMQIKDRDNNVALLNLSLDGDHKKPNFMVSVKADKFNIADILLMTNNPDMVDGMLSLYLRVQSSGKSTHEFAANLNGTVLAFSKNSLVDNKKLRKLIGINSNMVTDILLGRSKDKIHSIYCMAFDSQINSGIVNLNTALIDTKITTISAKGDINLAKEILDVTLMPHRTGAKLPTVAPILLSGNFKSPKYGLSSTNALLGLANSLLGGGSNITANDNNGLANIALSKAVQSKIMGGNLRSEKSPCLNLRPSMLKKQKIDQKQILRELRKDPEKILKNLFKGLF